MSLRERLEARHGRLVAQCPPPPVFSSEQAAALPIHVDRYGTDGPRVLIVHGGVQGGLGGGADTFVEQQSLAEQGFRLELVHRPGFGRSPSRGVDDMPADAVWIADMLGDGAHLIGHSWGGAASLLAAARRPQSVKSLILVEPALQSLMMATGGPVHKLSALMAMLPVGWPMARAKTPAAYARAFAGVLGRPGPRTSSFLQSGEMDEVKAAQLGCAFLHARMADGPTLLRAAEALRQAGTPVLCVTGGWGAMVDKTAATAARAAGGRCVVVRSPNHFPQLENPERFNAVVGAFMHEHD